MKIENVIFPLLLNFCPGILFKKQFLKITYRSFKIFNKLK